MTNAEELAKELFESPEEIYAEIFPSAKELQPEAYRPPTPNQKYTNGFITIVVDN